ncbi:hypothetical protein [Reichenbachiella sp.]
MKYMVLVLLIGGFLQAKSQQGVGIGTDVVEDDATLQIESTTGGLLIPRMSTTQRTTLGATSAGLIVYDTNLEAFIYFDGTNWLRLVVQPAQLNLDMSNHQIVNLSNGTSANDAVNKNQLDLSASGVDGDNLSLDGSDQMAGVLNMGNYKIENVSDGVNASDVATKSQLDNLEIPELFSAVGGSSSFVGGVRWTIIDTGNTDNKKVDLTAWSDINQGGGNGYLTIQIRGGNTSPANSTANSLVLQRNFRPNVSTIVSQEALNFGIFNTNYRYFHIRVEPKDGATVGYYGLKVRVLK